MSELSAHELEDHVLKKRKVYVRRLNSPNIQVMKKDWLAISCGDFGARGSEGDEMNNEDYVLGVLKGLRGEAVVAEGGLRKRQSFNTSCEEEEQ